MDTQNIFEKAGHLLENEIIMSEAHFNSGGEQVASITFWGASSSVTSHSSSEALGSLCSLKFFNKLMATFSADVRSNDVFLSLIDEIENSVGVSEKCNFFYTLSMVRKSNSSWAPSVKT